MARASSGFSTWRRRWSRWRDASPTPVVYLDTDTRLFGRTCCVVAHDSDATGRRAADELLKLNLARYAFLPYRRPTFWSDLRGSYGGLSPPHHAFVSPSTLTKNVAAGRFTSSSFKSSGGSRYCSAGEGNPATTDPTTCAFFDMNLYFRPCEISISALVTIG